MKFVFESAGHVVSPRHGMNLSYTKKEVVYMHTLNSSHNLRTVGRMRGCRRPGKARLRRGQRYRSVKCREDVRGEGIRRRSGRRARREGKNRRDLFFVACSLQPVACEKH